MEPNDDLNPESSNLPPMIQDKGIDPIELIDASQITSDEQTVSSTPDESAEKQKTVRTRKKIKSTNTVKDKKSETEDEMDEHELTDTSEIIEPIEHLSTTELVDMLETLNKESDFNLIKAKVALLKIEFRKKIQKEKEEHLEKFIAEGGEKNDFHLINPIEDRFNKAFEIYRKNRTRYLEQQELQKQRNLEAKKKVLENIKALIESEEALKKTYDDFKDLQNKWKEIGTVPKNEINNLWQSYHFLVEKFLDKVKINKELKDLDLKKNLESKIELCEKAEELLLEPSVLKAFKQLQKLHDTWKEIGPIAEDKKDEVWERFKSVTDKIHERRRSFYDDQKKERENNLLAKIAICEKAESINDLLNKTQKDWRKATEEIQELQKVWRTIGFAPEDQNNDVWHRFRSAVNLFFENKKEYFDKLQDDLTNNYNLKLDICNQAEALKDSRDWNRTTRELINLQKDWKEIGPVPLKHSDALWKRFRAACDVFFENKEHFFKNVDSIEIENMTKKQELIKKVEEYPFGENNKENIEILKNFQREWVEIGHVPIKEKDKLQNDFKTVLNKHFEKLKISAFNKTAFEYQTRFDAVKDTPDAARFLFKEKSFIQNVIQKIKGDINLWENNLGFLAKSKSADVVKEEFQKKIERAKADLQAQEQKLKFIIQQEKELKTGK